MNSNLLTLRILLTIGNLLFVFHSIFIGKVHVEMAIFRGIFMIINFIYSLILILKILPIKLSPIEQTIYERDFSKVMSKYDFKDLIEKGHFKSISVGGRICNMGDNFSGLYYIAYLNPNYKIYYYKNRKRCSKIKENSWIGIVEYMMYSKEKLVLDKINKNDKEKSSWEKLKTRIKWGLSAVVEEIPDKIKKKKIYQDYKNDTIIDGHDCYVYEFSLEVLEKLFGHKKCGVIWKNALYGIWLKYVTKLIRNIDKKVTSSQQLLHLNQKRSKTQPQSVQRIWFNRLESDERTLWCNNIKNEESNNHDYLTIER